MRTVIIILVFLFNNSPAWAQSFDRLDFRRYSNRLWRITNSVIVEADESDRSAFQVQFDYKIGSALRSMNFNAYQPRHLSSSLLWTPQMRLSDYRRASLLGQVKDVVNPENRIVYRALWSISDGNL